VSDGQAPFGRAERLLWATLPIGIALLVTWVAWLAIEIVLGDTVSIESAVLGFVNSLVLIVSGLYYRRALRRR
jgi:hypothetical protein